MSKKKQISPKKSKQSSPRLTEYIFFGLKQKLKYTVKKWIIYICQVKLKEFNIFSGRPYKISFIITQSF